MKKRSYIALLLITLLFVTACGRGNGGISTEAGTETGTETESDTDFLTEKRWEYNTLSCTEVLVFDKEGTFSYYETCGNPVGDSDMYETYSYDKEKQVITVHSSDDSLEDMEIEVLRYVKDSLLVRINGSIKEFERNNDVPTPVSDVHDKLEGYSTYLALRNIENGMIETAPAYVDMDAGGRKFIREEKLADTVEIFNLYEKIVHPDGEKPDELTTEFSELTIEDVAYSEDNSFSAGYVWYNDDLEIIKIVYYGSMEIWE